MKRMKRGLAALLSGVCLLSGWGGAAAAQDDGIPTYELARFSDFERTYAEESGNLLYGDTLYADWTRADGVQSDTGIDVQTGYGNRENLRLLVTLDLTSSEASLLPDTAWEGITVKLRSVDVENKEGDPSLTVNGGNHETNSEHNYGWDIRPGDVQMENGHLELSIPLNRPADNSRGLMDWTQVQRILLTLQIADRVVADGMADCLSMRLSEVRIVNDIMNITREEIRQAASDEFPQGKVYSQESMELFEQTRQQALALTEDKGASLIQLEQMAQQMWEVRRSMTEITYGAADFSRICGTYPGEDMQTLYADWAYAGGAGDGFGVDLSQHDFDHLMLQIELELTGPEGYTGDWNEDGWILLRSADPQQRLCTYGFRLASSDSGVGALHAGTNRLSIPLSAGQEDGYTVLQSDPEDSDRQGTIDWTAINRLHVYIQPEGYQKGDFSMTITMARIVDVTLPQQELPALDALLQGGMRDEDLYTPDSWQNYREAWEQAQAVRDGYLYASAQEISAAAQALEQAALALEEKPAYELGDVDEMDGVTSADALLALQAATGKIDLTDGQKLAADVDGQVGVTSADALMILQFATQKINSFPVG